MLYNWRMEVAVSALRANLSEWIDRARSGDEIVVTERGTPVARLVPVDAAPLLERLARQGVLSPPSDAARPSARATTRVSARGWVSDLFGEQRR